LELFAARSALATYTVERLGLLFDIRLNNAHGREQAAAEKILQMQVGVIEKVNKDMGVRLGFMSLVLGLMLAIAMAYLAYGALNLYFTAGDFVLVGGYAGLMAAKLRLVAGSIIDLERSKVALEIGVKYLNRGTEWGCESKFPAKEIQKFTGYELNNVSIEIDGFLLFRPVTAKISPNTMTIISGRSGVLANVMALH